MTPDLSDAAARLAAGRASAVDLLEHSLAMADAEANRYTFVRRFDDAARAAARQADEARRAGARQPLAGLAITVKDLFDVAGAPTTAASRVLADAPAAAQDAPAVARLRAAGATILGHTNMTEFAFSGVGINPHYGTPPNPVTASLDPSPRIPGGSTSGGAVSVATGAAWAALGSDTGGSVRIPAALQGLVGFKNTQRLTPLDGTVPLSTTLDTACAITRTVRDAILVHEILAQRRVTLSHAPLAARRLALPSTAMIDALEPAVAEAFERTVGRLRAAGAAVVEMPCAPLEQLSTLQAGGGFAAAEAWAWHRRMMSAREGDYDPRVAARIRRGASMSAADYIDLIRARCGWIDTMGQWLHGFDAAISPTLPVVAPPLQPLIDDDERFFATNALLLRNPSVVNLLDGCGVSLPCHRTGDWPVGLMVWAPALQDDAVLDIALQIEDCLAADAA
jgi:aspartyl-tRNA(Asn)/glutamyl-tRNA(Gln) amidotransferase subunit A